MAWQVELEQSAPVDEIESSVWNSNVHQPNKARLSNRRQTLQQLQVDGDKQTIYCFVEDKIGTRTESWSRIESLNTRKIFALGNLSWISNWTLLFHPWQKDYDMPIWISLAVLPKAFRPLYSSAGELGSKFSNGRIVFFVAPFVFDRF